MREGDPIPELEKEMMLSAHPFYLYKCGHVSDDSYPTAGIIPLGQYANILICKHCWQNLSNMFLTDLFERMIRRESEEPVRVMLKSMIDQMRQGNGN